MTPAAFDALLAHVDHLETHAEGQRYRVSLAFWRGVLVGASTGLAVALVVRFLL